MHTLRVRFPALLQLWFLVWTAVLLALSGCVRTIWVNELDVPGLCPDSLRQPRVTPLRLQTSLHAGRAVITGQVQRTEDGSALRGAQVLEEETRSYQATTDSRGRFTWRDVPAGVRVLRTYALGYHSRLDTLRIQDNTRTELVLQLTPQPLDGTCSGIAAVPVRKRWPW